MSSSGSRTTYRDQGNYYRSNDRVVERERRYVREIPYEEIDDIRNRELAPFRAPYAPAQLERRDGYDRSYDGDYYDSRQIARRNTLAPPIVEPRYERGGPSRSSDARDRRRDYSPPQRERQRREYYSDDSDSESSRERRRRRRHRRARSEAPANDDDDDGGRLWYSMKNRKDGNWLEKSFDSSYDGLLAAAAGAAIGAVTAKHFAGEENRKWKTLGSAVAGAAAFNGLENQYRVYTEVKQEKREKKGEINKGDPGMDGPLELGGQLVAGGMLPGM